MLGGRIGKFYPRMRKPGGVTILTAHRYTIREPRIDMKPEYDDSAATMVAYHKKIIIALAKRYSGEKLDRKLKELRFCSFETAKEVIENDGK